MPVVLNIIETETELGIIESQVVIESASEPGPPGVGVPAGGTTGQILAKASNADYDDEWIDATEAGGSGVVVSVVAGTNIDVDATDPANPIVSVEALVDADIPAGIARDSEVATAVADEATARDAAIETHRADTTNVHGITDTAALVLTDDARLTDARTPTVHATSHQDGGTDELALDGSQITSGTVADARIAATLARDAEVTAAVDAEAALARNGDNITSGTVADARIAGTIARDSEVTTAISTSEAGQVRDGDAAGGVLSGTYPNPGFAADMATQAELDAKVDDTAYDATTWNGDTTHAPSKNAVRDKIESLGSASVDDTAYDATTWNGVTATAPSKNAVRDEMELRAPKASPTFTGTVTLPSDQALAGNPTTTTQTQGNSSTRLATTAYVQTEVGLLVPNTGNSNIGGVKTFTTADSPVVVDEAYDATAWNGDLSVPTKNAVRDKIESFGTYTAYTPTLAQNGTRTTSAALGRYTQLGKHVHCWGKVTCSAAGSAGSAISISLPVSISASAAAEQILGAGWVQDLGTIWMPAVCAYFGSDTIAFIKTNADVENWIGAAPSYALASGDIINWNITYEAA